MKNVNPLATTTNTASMFASRNKNERMAQNYNTISSYYENKVTKQYGGIFNSSRETKGLNNNTQTVTVSAAETKPTPIVKQVAVNLNSYRSKSRSSSISSEHKLFPDNKQTTLNNYSNFINNKVAQTPKKLLSRNNLHYQGSGGSAGSGKKILNPSYTMANSFELKDAQETSYSAMST